MKPHYFRNFGAFLLLSAILHSNVFAAETPLLQIGEQPLYAIRSGDQLCVGFRDLCEFSGYRVSWDNGLAIAEGKNRITASYKNELLTLTIDEASYSVHSNVQLLEGRTIVPVRDLAKILGFQVHYNEVTGTAVILSATDHPIANYTEDDLYWLTRIIEAEAGAESLEGKIAVGNVVLNRVHHPDYPNTIYGVIFDTKYGTQFEPTSNGTIYNQPSSESIEAAIRVLKGENIIGDALYFYNPSLVDAVWIRTNCSYIETIGCHDFYL